MLFLCDIQCFVQIVYVLSAFILLSITIVIRKAVTVLNNVIIK